MTCQLDALCTAALLLAEFQARACEEAGERALIADDERRAEDFQYWCDVMVGIEELQKSDGSDNEAQELASIYAAMLADFCHAELMMSR